MIFWWTPGTKGSRFWMTVLFPKWNDCVVFFWIFLKSSKNWFLVCQMYFHHRSKGRHQFKSFICCYLKGHKFRGSELLHIIETKLFVDKESKIVRDINYSHFRESDVKYFESAALSLFSKIWVKFLKLTKNLSTLNNTAKQLHNYNRVKIKYLWLNHDWLALWENCLNIEFFLVRVLPYLDWIRKFTLWVSVFSSKKRNPYLNNLPAT